MLIDILSFGLDFRCVKCFDKIILINLYQLTMANKIPKKGDHEPTKYFEGEGKLNNSEKLTEQKITVPQEFSEYDIENLCSKYLMNIMYYKMAKKRKREEALNIAANVVLKKGEEIKNQLNQNDLEISKKKDQTVKSDSAVQGQEAAQTQSEPNPKGGKADIPKISGGTLSEVISKMNEMLSGKSGAEFDKGAQNFSAMIEVLASPEVEKKFADVMQHLAVDPILVVGIEKNLEGTKGASIFAQAVEGLNNEQKQAISNVRDADVALRQAENASENLQFNAQKTR